MGFRTSGWLLGHGTKKIMVAFLPLTISVTLCAVKQRSEMILAVCIKAVLQQLRNQTDPLWRVYKPTNQISVHKTDMCAASDDPNTICPLHNKPHPLKKCRTFRNKLLDDRKAFLKEKGICFKCCSSVSHLTKECKSSVKCSECGSTYHDAAMHPGPSPQVVKPPSPSQEDGGEGEDHSNMAVVNTSCIEVCAHAQKSAS